MLSVLRGLSALSALENLALMTFLLRVHPALTQHREPPVIAPMV